MKKDAQLLTKVISEKSQKLWKSRINYDPIPKK